MIKKKQLYSIIIIINGNFINNPLSTMEEEYRDLDTNKISQKLKYQQYLPIVIITLFIIGVIIYIVFLDINYKKKHKELMEKLKTLIGQIHYLYLGSHQELALEIINHENYLLTIKNPQGVYEKININNKLLLHYIRSFIKNTPDGSLKKLFNSCLNENIKTFKTYDTKTVNNKGESVTYKASPYNFNKYVPMDNSQLELTIQIVSNKHESNIIYSNNNMKNSLLDDYYNIKDLIKNHETFYLGPDNQLKLEIFDQFKYRLSYKFYINDYTPSFQYDYIDFNDETILNHIRELIQKDNSLDQDVTDLFKNTFENSVKQLKINNYDPYLSNNRKSSFNNDFSNISKNSNSYKSSIQQQNNQSNYNFSSLNNQNNNINSNQSLLEKEQYSTKKIKNYNHQPIELEDDQLEIIIRILKNRKQYNNLILQLMPMINGYNQNIYFGYNNTLQLTIINGSQFILLKKSDYNDYKPFDLNNYNEISSIEKIIKDEPYSIKRNLFQVAFDLTKKKFQQPKIKSINKEGQINIIKNLSCFNSSPMDFNSTILEILVEIFKNNVYNNRNNMN